MTSARFRCARASGCSGPRSSSTATSAGRSTETSAGEPLFEEACRKGWEGLIAKRADSPYVTTRSKDWLKFKCEHGQELVIGGYTEPRGSRVEFGALLLGYYRDGRLEYAGKVGTGFDTDTLHELGAQLRDLKRSDTAFANPGTIKERHVSWVEPAPGGSDRVHRVDARRAAAPPTVPGPPRRQGRRRGGPRAMNETVTAGRHEITVTHADRAVFPQANLSKLDLARHYERVAPLMLPYMRDRPLALQAYPQGIEQKGFFLKSVPRLLPGVDQARDAAEEGRDDHPRAGRRTPRRSCTWRARTW